MARLMMLLVLISCASKNNSTREYKFSSSDEFLNSQFKNSCQSETKVKIKGLVSKLRQVSDSKDRISLWYELGNCYYVDGDFKLGNYFYSLFIGANDIDNSKNSNVYSNMAVMMDTKDQRFLALEYFNKAIKLNPKNLGAKYLLGLFLIKTAEPERAAKIFNSLVIAYPGSRVLRSAQAVTFYLAGDIKTLNNQVRVYLVDKEKEIFSAVVALEDKKTRKKQLERLKQIQSDIGFVNDFKETILFNLENNESFKD